MPNAFVAFTARILRVGLSFRSWVRGYVSTGQELSFWLKSTDAIWGMWHSAWPEMFRSMFHSSRVVNWMVSSRYNIGSIETEFFNGFQTLCCMLEGGNSSSDSTNKLTRSQRLIALHLTWPAAIGPGIDMEGLAWCRNIFVNDSVCNKLGVLIHWLLAGEITVFRTIALHIKIQENK